MIVLLLGSGSVLTDPPPVVTPAERWITFNKLGGFFTPQQQLDPSDILDYVVDLRPLLESGETFTALTVAVRADSAAIGFQINEDEPFAPEVLENGLIRIWVSVEEADRTRAQWDRGTACYIVTTAVTDSSPPRDWQKTSLIVVMQK